MTLDTVVTRDKVAKHTVFSDTEITYSMEAFGRKAEDVSKYRNNISKKREVSNFQILLCNRIIMFNTMNPKFGL